MSDYQPISCEYHDALESWSVLKSVCEIEYRTQDGSSATIKSRIVDIYARQGEEFLVVETGEAIRLDHLVAVNGQRLPENC
jgi:Rho-binding antiterminator